MPPFACISRGESSANAMTATTNVRDASSTSSARGEGKASHPKNIISKSMSYRKKANGKVRKIKIFRKKAKKDLVEQKKYSTFALANQK